VAKPLVPLPTAFGLLKKPPSIITMSIQPPQGILTIPNATLRVGRLQVDEVKGFDTVLNTFDKNTILEEDSEVYDDDKKWGVKMPNIFVATFEIKGAGSSFNFRNTSTGTATTGYTLTFSGTTLTLKYDDSVPILATATIPNLDATYGKVYLTYEKQYFTVTVDGTRVLAYKDDVTRTPPDGEYINFFAGTGTPRFQNLKVVAGHLISDGTSNVSLYGGLAVTSNLEVGQANLFVDTTTSRVGVGTTEPEATLHVSGNAYVSSNLEVGSSNLFVDTVNSRVGVGTDTPKESLDVVGNMHLTRVSNVSQIKVDSNVVTEYTGPHDRPLRKYPEVAMTANDNSSTSGYVVDKSEESSSGDAYAAYRAFDGIIPDGTTTIGWRTDSGYNQDTGLADGGVTRFTGDSGEWVELQLPNSIKLSSIVLKVGNQGNNLANSQRRFPKVFVIYGYNGTSWDRIQEYTTSAIQSLTDVQTFHISNPTAYHNKFVLVVKQTYSVTGATSGVTNIGELELYGHEEGSGSLDTTLKSVYNVPATTGTQLEVYYDAKDLTAMPSTVTDLSPNSNGGSVAGATLDETGGIESFRFDGNDYISTTVTGLTGTSVTMSVWVNVNSIDTSRINSIVGLGAYPGSGSSIWIAIDGSQRFYTGISGLSKTVENSSAFTNNWVHLTMTIGTGELALYQDATIIGKVSGVTFNPDSNPVLYLGTRSDGSGNPESTRYFTGSIANFRLYSKALNADQVKELYDYQKDYFLGSKSQVTLYKGHLGVGVTEPSGQLELAGDERIQEYPPRGLTGYETLVEGHGVFCASVSSYYTPGGSSFTPFSAFDHNSVSRWATLDTAGYTNGVYTGSDNFTTNGGYVGEWIQLEVPYPIKLRYVSINPGNYANSRSIRAGYILGSTNGVEWNVITNFTGITYSDNKFTTIEAPATSAFRYFRMVVTNVQSTGTMVDITELKFFGTPGPTTLDKGSLSLGRSLDVPRVSRYDVDTETPRPEKLVVDFDTTVNSSPTDISGQGNHGTFYGATYSPADKAFKFDGTDDVIYNGGIGNWTDNISHTFSFWFKCESVNASNYGGSLVNLYNTTSTVNHYSAFSFSTGSSGVISFYHFGNDFTYNYPFELNRWYHVAGVYSGSSTTQKVYVDGVDLGPGTAAPGSDTSGLLLGTNPKLSLGGDFGRSDYYFDGQISNFKLYNVALEPSEVQKLYRLGRTGRSMVISDTAIGIGKVPEAQLDVRGNILYTGTSRPHALPTMWNHMDMGRNGPGVYPIIGTQGGSKVYNVYCEPDIFGGGWMCFTQIPQGGGGFNHNTVNLYTFDSGDSGNLKRTKFFNVPYNILSNTNGVNCDILVLAYGDILRYNMQGAKVGAIWRGVDLNTHFNSVINQSQIGYNAAQATSADGITFTSLSANLDKPSGWEFSISTEGNTTGSYNNYDDGTGGFIIHTAAGKSYSLYGHVRGPDGNWNYSSSTDFEIVRIFVRPSQF
jgi:hypothetical protein